MPGNPVTSPKEDGEITKMKKRNGIYRPSKPIILFKTHTIATHTHTYMYTHKKEQKKAEKTTHDQHTLCYIYWPWTTAHAMQFL